MELWNRIKITVLKKVYFDDIAAENLSDEMKNEGHGICNIFKEEQEFFLSNPDDMPKGFCPWAWADLHRDVVAMLTGSQMKWNKDGVAISCCTDGYRPVVFRIERV